MNAQKSPKPGLSESQALAEASHFDRAHKEMCSVLLHELSTGPPPSDDLEPGALGLVRSPRLYVGARDSQPLGAPHLVGVWPSPRAIEAIDGPLRHVQVNGQGIRRVVAHGGRRG